MSIAKVTDHEAEALARLPSRYREKDAIEALVRVLVGPVQAIEDALWQLLTERGIETGSGVTLSEIGDLIGEPRASQDDEAYRPYLRARVATSRSNGTTESLIRVARVLLNDPTAQIVVRQPGAAAVTITVEGVALADALADTMILFLRAAKAGGVRLRLVSSAAAPAATMRWGVTDQGWGTLWGSSRT